MAFRLFHIHVTSYSIDASEDSSPQTSCLKKFTRKNIGHRLCEKKYVSLFLHAWTNHKPSTNARAWSFTEDILNGKLHFLCSVW